MTPNRTETIELKTTPPDWLPPAVRDRMAESGSVEYRFELSRAERKVYRVPRPIRPSKWAERHRVLTMSSLPGRWKNETTPYLTDMPKRDKFSIHNKKPPTAGQSGDESSFMQVTGDFNGATARVGGGSGAIGR